MGFASEEGLGTKLHAAWEELTCGSQPREQEIAVYRTRAVDFRGPSARGFDSAFNTRSLYDEHTWWRRRPLAVPG